MENGISWGHPESGAAARRKSPVLISLGKMNIVTGLMNQIPQKDVMLSTTQTSDQSSVMAVA